MHWVATRSGGPQPPPQIKCKSPQINKYTLGCTPPKLGAPSRHGSLHPRVTFLCKTIPNPAAAPAWAVSHRDRGAGELRSWRCHPLSLLEQYNISSVAWSIFKLISRRIISSHLTLI